MIIGLKDEIGINHIDVSEIIVISHIIEKEQQIEKGKMDLEEAQMASNFYFNIFFKSDSLTFGFEDQVKAYAERQMILDAWMEYKSK